ncbi:oligopeptidase A [Corallincola spongiicola]|uniref:oligopeptidase A n=1 Tax=Corallincola spongiicola TaxID=2520508 RepID=A0ABY1WNY7_9GAMM|nr:oligopeptidase A [Corallincola spongiicola]TAA45791.1 oligopeptidase A [Corallincola spongiicola]
MTNPLLSFSGLPRFSEIKPEHVKPAVEQLIADCKAVVEQVASSQEQSWEAVIAPLDTVNDKLSRAWSPVGHLNGVANTPELRDAYDSCLPLLSEYGSWVGQHQGLFDAYQRVANSAQFASLSQAQQEVIRQALRDFELAGVALPEDKKKRFTEISTRLSELGSQFSNNLLDATRGWSKLITDESELAGLPPTALAAAQQAAAAKEQEGYLLTLDFPCYLPVMSYCDNRELRKEIYVAFATRASDQGPNAGKWDNSEVMDEIVALRHEKARLLGFDNYGEYSLATKMAEKSGQVLGFLNDLAERSKPQGQKELDELRAYAKQQHGVENAEAWDLTYYSEKLKQHTYAIDAEAVRPWFPENRVVSGLFEVAKRLFAVDIVERQGVDTWHKDVRFFDIFNADGSLQGSFYLDLFAREGKRGGAWMDECQARWRTEANELQIPVAYLTCNFSGPVGSQPALFTHDEVITLFHEFGHGLHHMLTKVETAGVSGINGVPWDAVELPSQFLENWCWEPEALAFISGHFETGEPLPQSMLDKMMAAKNFQSAMQMLRQLEFSLFDFHLHLDFDPTLGAQVQHTLDQIRDKVAVVPVSEFNRFQHSFGHIFGGGYAAGYYSYKWAEVLSADAFGRFEEEGIFNSETGQSFLNEILRKGGSDSPMNLFRAFRGREPEVDALLRHSGIGEAA